MSGVHLIEVSLLYKVSIIEIRPNGYFYKEYSYISHFLFFFVSEPDPTTLQVRNLSETILITSKPDQYIYLVSWEMPLFNESKVNQYVITCSLSGNPDRAKRWQTITVVHAEFVVLTFLLSIFPIFSNCVFLLAMFFDVHP